MKKIIKAFWSWRDIYEAKGTSLSTEKREEKFDPDYPTKVPISKFRVGFPDDEVQRYFAILRERCLDCPDDERTAYIADRVAERSAFEDKDREAEEARAEKDGDEGEGEQEDEAA